MDQEKTMSVDAAFAQISDRLLRERLEQQVFSVLLWQQELLGQLLRTMGTAGLLDVSQALQESDALAAQIDAQMGPQAMAAGFAQVLRGRLGSL